MLELEGTVDSMNDEVAVISGRVTVDDRVVLEAREIMCALMDADRLADLDDTERLQLMLTQGGSRREARRRSRGSGPSRLWA